MNSSFTADNSYVIELINQLRNIDSDGMKKLTSNALDDVGIQNETDNSSFHVLKPFTTSTVQESYDPMPPYIDTIDNFNKANQVSDNESSDNNLADKNDLKSKKRVVKPNSKRKKIENYKLIADLDERRVV
jgi:hypothetical protein